MLLRTSTSWVILAGFSLSACATPGGPSASGEGPRQSRAECIAAHTVAGAAVGAVAGVLIAALSGEKKNTGKYAAAAGVAGGAMAFAYAWGKCLASFSEAKSTVSKDYQTASTEIGYAREKGLVVIVKDFDLSPGAVSPGGGIRFSANYYVMDTPDRADIEVTEARIVQVWNAEKKAFEELGSADEKVTIAPGMRTANGHVDLPEEMPLGIYKVGFQVTVPRKSGGSETATEWMTFEVTEDKAKLAKAQRESEGSAGSAGKEVSKGSSSTMPRVAEAAGGAKGTTTKQTLRVTCKSRLNVRDEPSLTGEVIGKVLNGEVYPVLENRRVKDELWYRIDIGGGKRGWVLGVYAQIED